MQLPIHTNSSYKMTVDVMETPSERLSASRQHMTEAARRMVYMNSKNTSNRNNDGSDDSGNGSASVVTGESVTISKAEVEDDDAPLGESVLPGLVCASESDVIMTGASRRESVPPSRRTTTAAELMCLQVPASAVACSNPLASPKEAPYSLAMVHSSEANAGYILNPPKPRRRRRASDGSAIVPNPASPAELSSSLPRASSIGFKTSMSPPSLRSITKGTKKRVERFDYAKALLRSDEELEKLSGRIRKEINESELFELALAAERAADAGEEKFAGRASTFGGEQQQNHHKYQPLSKATPSHHAATKNNKIDPRTEASRTYSTISTTTVDSSSSYMGGASDLMRTGIPTIGTTPNTPDRRLLMEKTRYPSSPGLILSASEPSLLETMVDIASPAPEEPGKRSMGVDSLRDINEVIPHWNELHGHMRTHLFRECVDKRTLVFDPKITEKETKQLTNVTTEPLKIDGSPTSSPKHRRSRSFLESLADIAAPHFAESPEQRRRQQVKSTGSFDFVSIFTKEDTETQVSASDGSESSGRKEKASLSKTTPLEDRPSGKPSQEHVRVDSDVLEGRTMFGETGSNARHEMPTSSRSLAFELVDFEKTIKSHGPRPPKNRSACSSEATSVASSCSDTDIQERLNHLRDFELSSKMDENENDCICRPEKETLFANAEAPMANKCVLSSVSDPPASPVPTSSLEVVSSESHQAVRTQGAAPTPPLTPNDSTIASARDTGFNTPAHLRVIKGIQKRSRIEEKFIDAPKQPQLRGKANIGDVASTPVGFPVPYEPNSIIDSATNHLQEMRFPERCKSSLQEVETRFLALPTISGSASDSSLKSLPARRITRRKINRSQWFDSPTTPTDQGLRSFLPYAKQQQDACVRKAASYEYETRVSHMETSHNGEGEHELPGNSEPENLSTSHSSSGEKSSIVPVLETHNEILDLVTKAATDPTLDTSSRFGASLADYKEEKKECEEDFHLSRHSRAQAEVPETDAASLPIVLFDRSDSLSTHRHVLAKSMSSPEEVCRGVSSELECSFNTTKSAPGCHSHSDDGRDTFMLKRTGTWNGVIVKKDSMDAIGAVNSLLSNTSAAVNDAAGFFADTITGDSAESNEVDESMCERSPVNDKRGPATTIISRLGVGNTLCHGEENFKAAVQGVLSHLSLSPRPRSQDVEIDEMFLPEPENKEFLRNYFYCTKQQDEDEAAKKHTQSDDTTMTEHPIHDENLDTSTAAGTGFGERIACATEPCNGHDPTCSMFGVDTVCNGFTYYLFATGTTDFDGSTGTNPSSAATRTRVSASQGHDTDVIPMQSQHHSRSASFSNENQYLSPGTPRHSGIDLHNQRTLGSDDPIHSFRRHSTGIGGPRESWVGMFQRVASERLSFRGDHSNEMERSSKHSFTPPCLQRRVLTRNTTK